MEKKHEQLSKRNKCLLYNINLAYFILESYEWLHKYVWREIKSSMSNAATKISSIHFSLHRKPAPITHFQFNSGPNLLPNLVLQYFSEWSHTRL